MSANNSQRVAEIFTSAGEAFQTLGSLTAQLESSGQNAKWTDQDISMLASAVEKFAFDLQVISNNLKSRTVTQIKGAIQKKMGVVQQITPQPQTIVDNSPSPMTTTKQNAEVTLNALNAEVDVESLEPSGNFN